MNPSVIAAGMSVLGNIISDGALDIDGHIDGNVRAQTISIRDNGKIRGDVVAEVLHVYGEIEGLIKAQTVMLYAGARVTGTIMHESLTIEDGASVDGKLKRVESAHGEVDTTPRRLTGPVIDANFDNDNEGTLRSLRFADPRRLRLKRDIESRLSAMGGYTLSNASLYKAKKNNPHASSLHLR